MKMLVGFSLVLFQVFSAQAAVWDILPNQKYNCSNELHTVFLETLDGSGDDINLDFYTDESGKDRTKGVLLFHASNYASLSLYFPVGNSRVSFKGKDVGGLREVETDIMTSAKKTSRGQFLLYLDEVNGQQNDEPKNSLICSPA